MPWPSPSLNQHFGFVHSTEEFNVQQLVAKLVVEGLTITVFPRASWFDEQSLRTDILNPLSDIDGCELKPIF